MRKAASLRGCPRRSRILSWGIWPTTVSETPSATRRRRCSRRRRALAAPDLRGRVVSLLRLLRDMAFSFVFGRQKWRPQRESNPCYQDENLMS